MKKWILVLTAVLLLFALAGCSAGNQDNVGSLTSGTSSTQALSLTSEPGATTTQAAVVETVDEVLAENSKAHAQESDYIWDSSTAVTITLNGSSISVSGAGVSVEGTTATITAAGTYLLSGKLDDGQILVNTDDEEIVRLVLDGVELNSSTSAPINIQVAEQVQLVLAVGSQNTVSDGPGYLFENPEDDEPNAAIFSKADLTIYGSGSLLVNGNYNDGIASKDGLVIAGGEIEIHAVDDGIRGKDYLVIQGGSLTIKAGGDGLKSDNEEDAAKGYIAVEAGVIAITASGDAIHAATDVLIKGGEFTLTAGGGSSVRFNQDVSAKGIKGSVLVNIDGGSFNIDAADDAIHSNDRMVINGGSFVIATSDDAMHADATLEINGGIIRVTKSFEGIESAVITINAGDINIVSSDDGINVAGGRDGSGMTQGMGPGGNPGAGRRPGQDAFNYTGDYYLYINGGCIVVTAAGDGMDVNGAIEMSDGVVIIHGPTENMNGALDYDAYFTITGGLFVAAGSAGMAQAPGETSNQPSLLVNFNSTLPAGTLFHVQDSSGNEIVTFSPSKNYQSVAFSSPALMQGTAYTVYLGGSATGSAQNGLYQGGSYSSGSEYTSFTVSGMVTMIGAGRFRP